MNILRHTEDIAPDMVWGASETEPGYMQELYRMTHGTEEDPGYIDQLLTLLANKPTTEELREADRLLKALAGKVKLLDSVVESWISSSCPVITRAEIDAENPLLKKVSA